MDATAKLAFASTLALALTVHAAPINPTAQAIENRADTADVAPGAEGARVIRAQILLDRARFSPGQIDGRYGGDLSVAVKGYEEAHHLVADGVIGAQMWRELNTDLRPLLTTYTITTADVKGPFAPLPEDVHEQAQLKWMGYASAQEALGEKFHASPQLLAQLNPGKDLTQAGQTIVVPSVVRGVARRASRVVVSAGRRTVTAFDAANHILGQYPATMGGEHDPLPLGSWTITSVQRDPWFYWDPTHFWNADPTEAKEKLPPGPRNPAGVVWMGLSKPHYGIHGTPDPGRIRHGESYGCIRLTNWDASDLARMVVRGIPAVLEE